MKQFILINLVAFFSLIINHDHLSAQTKDTRKVIQFSGVIVTGDSLMALPFVNVTVKGTRRGTYTDVFGFFSFAALESDTIIFSSLGYHRGMFVIPDTLTENKYSMIHVLHPDTVELKEVTIRPWPTREQFKDAFLNLQIKDDDLEKARANLNALAYYREVKNLDVDATSAYKAYSSQQNTKIFNNGLYPTTNLANPIAWVKFIDAWQKGQLKPKLYKDANYYYRDK